ncbi:MAG: hypothetical protein ACFFGZ_13235 [Candidatus Thorarchaeota archaeon]
MAKKITFQCTTCQQTVDIAPNFVSRAMEEAEGEEAKGMLVTCQNGHLNRVTVDKKSGMLLKAEKGRVPV